jgi:hypothetical protein
MRRPTHCIRFSSRLFAAALLAIQAGGAVHAEEDGAFQSLDSVDTGRTHSLDSVDTGQTHDLDDVDTGETHDLDEVDDGVTQSLDSVDTGRSQSLDSVDTGRTESLDSVVERAAEAPDAPTAPAKIDFPAIAEGDWEHQASRAKEYIARAEERLRVANATYAKMIQKDYPRGDERAVIIAERGAAQTALNESWSYFGRIKKRAAAAGRPL